jgi:hypothetical protein
MEEIQLDLSFESQKDGQTKRTGIKSMGRGNSNDEMELRL